MARNTRDPLTLGDSPFAEIGHPKKRAFLAAYAETGIKTRAAAMAGIAKQTIYTRQWREDPEFQAALERAKLMAAEAFEDEVARRALEGVERLTGWYRGAPGGVARDYSDNLLMFALKALLPDKYGNRVAARGSIAAIEYDKLPDHVIQRISDGEHPLSVLASVEPSAIDSGQPHRGTD